MTKFTRRFFSGLSPLLMLTLLASCQKENPIVSKEPQSAQLAAKAVVGDHAKKPASVRKPSATAITHSSARIKWQKASRAEEYIVLRRALYADNPESSLHSVHRTSGLSHDDTGLASQTEYIYRIVARNKAGEAKRSPRVKFRTLSEPEVEVVVREEEEVAEEFIIPEPDEPEAEFIPEEEEEEEEPLVADAAHVVEGSCEDPEKVEDLHVTNGFNDDGDYVVRLNWEEAAGADIYRVDRLNVTDPDNVSYADIDYNQDGVPDVNGVANPVRLAEVSTISYEDGNINANTTYTYLVYAGHNCLNDLGSVYTVYPMSARSHTVHITTPDFQGSAFSPPTPGCPEDRSNDGDRDNDYPRNISTCGVIPTNGDDIEGTLESRSDHDWYRVDLEEGRWQVYAYMEAADGRRVVLSGLYDHRGRKLPGWRNFSQNTGLYLNDTAAEFTVKRGTYFIDVHSAGFNSGRYSLSVSEQED